MKITKTANNKKKITLSKSEWQNMGKKAGWMNNTNKLNNPIIPEAIGVLSSNPDAVQFNDKASFEDFLNQQHYFSASYSHCYYSEEDLDASRNGDPKFREGTKGVSEADKGCVMLFETGRELVAIWDEKSQVGYILPKSI